MADQTPPASQHPSSSWLRRGVALCLDWAVASAISAGFFDLDPMATLGVFALMRVLLTATLGSSFGQRLLGLGIRRVDGRIPSVLQSLVRTLALCLVIPVGVTTREGRGMHDVWAGTRIVRIGQVSTGQMSTAEPR